MVFAGRFLSAGKEAADHDAGGSRGDGFGDVAGVFDATIGDDGDAGTFGGAGGFEDSGNLRDAGTGNDAGGADGTGADTDFEAVNAERDEIAGTIKGGDIAGDELDIGQAVADGFNGVHDPLGVAMSGVDGDDVGLGARHFNGALQVVPGSADGGADAEATLLVFGGARIFEFFLDIFDGDETFEVEVLIDNEEFFDAMFLENAFGFFQGGADGNGDEVGLGHHIADELGMIFFKAEIAIGEDAGEASAAGDGKAGDAVLGHDLEGLTEGDVWRDGDGIDDHAAFGAFDAINFFILPVDGHVAVNDADTALAGDSDGEAGLGDGIHGGGGERDIEDEGAGEVGACFYFGGKDGGFAGEQENVVKCETFGNRTIDHTNLTIGKRMELRKSGVADRKNDRTREQCWMPAG